MELRLVIAIVAAVILAIGLFTALSLWAACKLSGRISDMED